MKRVEWGKVLASTLVTSHLVLFISMDNMDGSIGRPVGDRGTMMGIDVSMKLATHVIYATQLSDHIVIDQGQVDRGQMSSGED